MLTLNMHFLTRLELSFDPWCPLKVKHTYTKLQMKAAALFKDV